MLIGMIMEDKVLSIIESKASIKVVQTIKGEDPHAE
jgi:hypothetical protein